MLPGVATWEYEHEAEWIDLRLWWPNVALGEFEAYRSLIKMKFFSNMIKILKKKTQHLTA